LAAALSGEKHEGGMLLLAAHLKLRGLPIFYFGVDLPLADLQTICRELRPKVITLSFSELALLKASLPSLVQLPVPVVVGGPALSDSAHLALLKSEFSKNVHFCDCLVGSEAAEFVEMICHTK
jgi:hypothetical protein